MNLAMSFIGFSWRLVLVQRVIWMPGNERKRTQRDAERAKFTRPKTPGKVDYSLRIVRHLRSKRAPNAQRGKTAPFRESGKIRRSPAGQRGKRPERGGNSLSYRKTSFHASHGLQEALRRGCGRHQSPFSGCHRQTQGPNTIARPRPARDPLSRLPAAENRLLRPEQASDRFGVGDLAALHGR